MLGMSTRASVSQPSRELNTTGGLGAWSWLLSKSVFGDPQLAMAHLGWVCLQESKTTGKSHQ